jgi:hypothetical protein
MGLRELTTYKWVVQGDYTVRPSVSFFNKSCGFFCAAREQ